DGQADSNTATVNITIATTTLTFGLDSGEGSWNVTANYLDAMRFQNNIGRMSFSFIAEPAYPEKLRDQAPCRHRFKRRN
ncbi:MAG: hypothetical protein KJ687_02845, partial [Proteobacteria bacterium]|nr:hypothetical protein [Pseudomonadota bacterium]